MYPDSRPETQGTEFSFGYEEDVALEQDTNDDLAKTEDTSNDLKL